MVLGLTLLLAEHHQGPATNEYAGGEGEKLVGFLAVPSVQGMRAQQAHRLSITASDF